MPMDRKRYPTNWEEISRAIRGRSGGQCECTGECGAVHDGVRWFRGRPSARCGRRHGAEIHRGGARVVLTVAHLCHHPECSDPDHLRAMCQACHLTYDAPIHGVHAARTRARRSAQPGLFDKRKEAPSATA